MNASALFARSGLSIERLQSFLRVVDAGTIAAAAGRDAARQSQFSRQIKELEAFFEAPLTERAGRRIAINGNGRRLAGVVRAFLADMAALKGSMEGRAPTLALGAGISVLDFVVAPHLPELSRALNGARIDLLPFRTRDAVGALQDGRLDIGVVREDALPKALPREALGTLTYALFVPKPMLAPAPPKTAKGLDALLGRLPMIMVAGEGRLRESLEAAFILHGITPQIVSEVGSLTQAAALVRARHAAAVLPTLMADRFEAKTTAILHPPCLAGVKRPLALAWNRPSLQRANLEGPDLARAARAIRVPAG